MVQPWQDIPLAAGRLARFAERRRDQEWLTQAQLTGRCIVLNAVAECLVAVVGEEQQLVDGSGEVSLRGDAGLARRFLGIHDDRAHFAITVPTPHTESRGDSGTAPGLVDLAAGTDLFTGNRQWAGLRQLAPTLTPIDAEMVTTAVALQHWHARHQFCPHCAAPTHEADAGWLRICSAEGTSLFPRTDPAVIMLIHDGNGRVLLGRSPAWGSGRFSTLAGFVEPGESLEAAVAREVLEETGVVISDVRYIASQPWPFPASVMIGFTALADSTAPIRVDPAELAEAGWFTREEIAQARHATDGLPVADSSVLKQISPKLSISRYLIDQWLDADTPGLA